MSAVEGAADERAPETAYYQAVEEFFVSRRGDPLFVSNADWLLIHEWKQAGVPLRVVLRGIADALDGHAHSWSRAKNVGSLAYCKNEVEVARDPWQRALALGEEEGADTAAQLSSLAEGLAGATLSPALQPLAAGLALELRELAAAPPAGSLEKQLQRLETRLRTALLADTDPEVLARHDAAIERELQPYAQRMPAKVLEQIRAEARTRRLFEFHGLPRLSLFAL